MATLEARALGYGVGTARLLERLALSFDGGRFVAIVGPNGAGKTTLLRALAGHLETEGSVRIDAEDVRAMRRKHRARRLAFVASEDPAMMDLRVREAVTEGRYAHRSGMLDRSPHHDAVVSDALERTELTAFAERQLRTLSSGERRRVWIALGLAQEAEIVLLDEPTANLDISHAQQTLRTLRALANDQHMILAVLHDLNEAAQFADDVVLLDRGRLVASGTPREVLTVERIERAYGVRVEIATVADGTMRMFPA